MCICSKVIVIIEWEYRERLKERVFERSSNNGAWQCLTWLVSESDFSLKAVSDFELVKHWTTLAILNTLTENHPPHFTAFEIFSRLDFWGEHSFSFITYIVIHISIHPSKRLCSKMATGEVGVSLPWSALKLKLWKKSNFIRWYCWNLRLSFLT